MIIVDTKTPKSKYDFQAILTGDNKKVLQFGRYPSAFSRFLKDNGCKLTIVTNDHKSLKYDKKYDVILLGNSIETITNHIDFLKKLPNMLETGGYIISSVSNISYIINRIQFLNNEFNFPSNTLHYFNLGSLLFTLSDSSFSLTKLIRIEKPVIFAQETSVKDYAISAQLSSAILKDPESNTTDYVFSATPTKNIDHESRKWLMGFTKDIVSERLKEIFDYQEKDVVNVLREREIDYLATIDALETILEENNITMNNKNTSSKSFKLKNIVDAKDEVIKHHEGAIKDKEKRIYDIVNAKDEIIMHHEGAIKDKEKRIHDIVNAKDEVIDHHEQALHAKDDVIYHHEQALKAKDDLITHYENIINSLDKSTQLKILRKLGLFKV
jgi:hypothetical protein